MTEIPHICVGIISCTSGKILVSDPSYPFDKNRYPDGPITLSTLVNNVRLGEFRVYCGWCEKYSNRVPEVFIIHKEYLGSFDLHRPHLEPHQDTTVDQLRELEELRADENKSLEGPIKWIKQPRVVAVDTGQAGFYEATVYPEDGDTGEYGDVTSFYGFCCSLTEKDTIGILATEDCTTCGVGVVCRSGWGDGLYPLYFAYNQAGEVIGIKIDFQLLELESQMMAIGLIPSDGRDLSVFRTEILPAGTEMRHANFGEYIGNQENQEPNHPFVTQIDLASALRSLQ